MVCPRCRTPNPEGTVVCVRCAMPIGVDDATVGVSASDTASGDATVAIESQGTAWSKPATLVGDVELASSRPLDAGTVLADRYEIIKMLGEGGMGAVYRARDRELDRLVALKVIRPELARNAQVLARFKQELILARQITHRNIIRIFDLGTAVGTRFITMEYIEGEDLSSILATRGKLPAAEAVGIVIQVFRGLEAAHAEGVVHRDLKPQNIMLDQQGKALVMDFGIARSMDASNMTRTGALLGTPTYMSPEQAQGQKVDARSDLYTMGVILYELLTGKPPFECDNPMATLVKRIQEKPVAPIELEPSIPQAINQIILKMLGTLPGDRYQTASEVLADLEAWEAQRTGRTINSGSVPPPATARNEWPTWIAGAAILVMGTVTVWMYLHRAPAGPPAAMKTVTVLVADFKNSTGDPVFDGTLEPAVGLAFEGASFISAYSRGDAHRAAAQLKNGTTTLDANLARQVANREGVEVVASGEIGSKGSSYHISLQAVDAATGNLLADASADAASKQEVLATASKLVTPIRKELGDKTPEAAQKHAAETYSSASLEAAQSYAKGQDLQWAGKWDEAIQAYEQAVKQDPNMGRAYTGLAVTYSNLGRRQEAEQYFTLAQAKLDAMTDREKFRTRGAYFLFRRSYDKAIQEFAELIKLFPADDAGHANLALAYFYRREIPRAIEEGKQAIAIYPKNLLDRNNEALYEMYGGQFDASITQANDILKQNPDFSLVYVPIALSQLAMGKTTEAEASYRKLATLGTRGASLAAIGLADLAMYEGRNAEAVKILKDGIASDLGAKNNSAAAVKMAALAGAERNRSAAVEAANRALATDPSPETSFAAGRALAESGQEGKAQEVVKKLSGQLEPEPQAYAALLEGDMLLSQGKAAEAIRHFQDAGNKVNTWIGHLDLARAYIEAGAFTEASSELDACQHRIGEATAVFLDDIPSFRWYAPVYYYAARTQEGMKSAGAADSYKTFLAIKAKADAGDPLVADAKKRLAALGR